MCTSISIDDAPASRPFLMHSREFSAPNRAPPLWAVIVKSFVDALLAVKAPLVNDAIIHTRTIANSAEIVQITFFILLC